MRVGWIIVAGLAAGAAGTAGRAQAPERVVVSGAATTLHEQRQALRDARAQASQARAISQQLEAKAARATAEADRINARAAALAARIQESEAELRAGEARILIVNRMVAAQSARLAGQQGPLVRLAAALQSFARRPPVLALLQPGSLTDAVHVRAVFSRVLPAIQLRTASVRADLARSRALRAMSVQAHTALMTSRRDLAERRTALGRLETQKRIAARGLASGATVEAERAMAIGERARDLGELVGQLEAAGVVRARLASLPGPQQRPARPRETPLPARQQADAGQQRPPAYRLPVIGTIITGMGELSDSGVRSRGVTVATRPSAQVIAPASGRVAFAGPYEKFGQIVIIDHGGGWSTLITDLGRLSVVVGDSVSQGTPVGTAPATGTPAITIELRRQGRPVDIAAMASTRG